MSSILRDQIAEFDNGVHLSEAISETFLDHLIQETDEKLLSDVLVAWDQKGIHEDEIYFIARILRERCTPVRSKHSSFVDVVGTGGSRVKTFNVSTAAAFVTAGAGTAVAKHGNRAATSNSGSADVLAELGIEPAVDAATAERCLNDVGICFMFAPNFHRLSPTLAKVRRGLGFPTIFNCVGPLCNPAAAPHQLIGVWSEELLPKIARALARLGTRRSWIVSGSDGLDEISITHATTVAEVESGAVTTFSIHPGDHGLGRDLSAPIRVESTAASAKVIRELFTGELKGTPSEAIVALNAAACLCLADRTATLSEGVRLALESIRGGHATRKLDQLAEAVRQ